MDQGTIDVRETRKKRMVISLLAAVRAWLRKKPKPLLLLVIVDVLIAALGLLSFSLYHFIIPRTYAGLGEVSKRPGAVAHADALAAATDAPEPSPLAEVTLAASETMEPSASPSAEMVTAEPAATADPVGYFGTKFADRFITGEPQTTSADGTTTYVSENVRIEGTVATYKDCTVYVCDIYIRDISNLSAGLADGKYGKGLRDWAKNIAKENAALVAINGDYYGARSAGVVIRNGELYRDDYSDEDVCVLYWDGTLEAYSPDDFDVEDAMARGAYQAWSFGPMLLDGAGTPLEDFNTSVGVHNPRTAIGYYEPGHYCFVVVDGRSDVSAGMTAAELASFMSKLGCLQAYNLDGGQTSVMVWGDKVVSVPYKGGRKTSDIIMITD
jgi:hypothetical protein